jgi:hypothetical protein
MHGICEFAELRPYLKRRWTKMLEDADHQSVLDSISSDPGVWFDEDDVEQ